MTGMAELILFGIKAGIRLAQQGKRIYIETTIERDLTLPLPNFDIKPSIGTADGYFHGAGQIYVDENPDLKELYDISMKQTREMTKDEKRRYMAFYVDYQRDGNIRAGEVDGDDIGLSKEALLSIVSVRQWANRKSPFPSPFQRIAGTLIEVGIDYFANIPGAVDEKSSTGRVLKGFLKSIDNIDFAEEKVDVLIRDLFIAVIETIGDNPALLNADKKTEKLVEAVATGLIKDAKERIEKLGGQDLDKRENVQDWTQLVLRSVLANAGEVIYASPGFYLEIDDPVNQVLVGSVGKSVLDVIIDSDTVDLSKLISREGLDTIVRAALKTVSENPELIGIDHKGLTNILSQIAIELADSSRVLGPDIIPEVMRLVLEKTAGNVEFLWPDEFRNDPAKHLLITASSQLLNLLSKTPGEGQWALRLSKSQVVELLNAVLDEVVENPGWLIRVAGKESSTLATAIEAALAVLRNIPPGRISPETLLNVIEATITAVALRRDLIYEIPLFGKQQMAILAVLEVVIDTIMPVNAKPDVLWILGRTEIFVEIVSTVLSRISETGVSEEILLKIRKALNETVEVIAAGKQFSLEPLLITIENISMV
ncbi:MAG: hypothetical protein KKC46_14155 [Proteobacteria bacterium]|nr:hypothetical protein [Pseudomonadota bacterium]